jgi:peptide deformylase
MIVRDPDPVLRQVAAPVEKIKLAKLTAKRLGMAMQESARAGRPAAGLAAPQIGESVRVFVLADYATPFINPVLTEWSEETDVAKEGCLSLPADMLVPVERSTEVAIRALDTKGNARVHRLTGFLARAAQHELDHLDGVLITDRRAAAAA